MSIRISRSLKLENILW